MESSEEVERNKQRTDDVVVDAAEIANAPSSSSAVARGRAKKTRNSVDFRFDC